MMSMDHIRRSLDAVYDVVTNPKWRTAINAKIVNSVYIGKNDTIVMMIMITLNQNIKKCFDQNSIC